MKFPVFNIRNKLTTQFVALVGILFLCFSIGIYYFGKLYIENRFYKRLQDRAVLASTIYFDFNAGQNTVLSMLGRKDTEILLDEMISIYDIQRKLFVISTDLKKETLHKYFLSDYEQEQFLVEKKRNNIQFVGITIKDKSGKYLVCVSATDQTGKDGLADIRNILSILSLVALILIGFQGWYFASKALEPISEVRSQLQEIFPKNLSKRVSHPFPGDEIGQMVQTINEMLTRAENATNAQKLFVANVSHELKNPLTKIFTQIEILELKYKAQPAILDSIISLKEDVKSIINLNEVILGLTNAYTQDASINMSDIRLDELLISVVTDFYKWHEDGKIVFEMGNIPDNENLLKTIGNADALQVVFKNLVDNAYKFSDNKTVNLKVNFGAMYIEVKVENTGTGIPEELKQKIFLPFFRADATAKGKKGHGVGLAIVKQILDIHKAKVNLLYEDNKTIFEVKLENTQV